MLKKIQTKISTSKDEELLVFAKQLVKEKKFEGVDSEVMEQIEKDVYDRLERRINGFIMAALPPEKLVDFDKLLEAADQSKIQEFCASNIENLEERLSQELVAFRQTYLGV